MNEEQVNLSARQAYGAMLIFLKRAYGMTHSDDLAGLLGGWQFSSDGGTMDPAAWNDWLAAVEIARQ